MTIYKELEENELSVATVQELYNNNTFEYCLIDNRLIGKTRNDLKLNYCKITADISNNKVIKITEFYNCYFENMRIINNKFEVVKFRNCKFENISISKCVAKEIIFENCMDTDEIDFTSNTIDLLDGAFTDENLLKMKNSITKITFNNSVEKEDEQSSTDENNNNININMEEKTDMEIVVQKDFENLTLTLNELNNKTYKSCNFFNCKFDESINLKANTDFMSCRFDSCEFSEGKYDKIAFDESEFFNTVFKGDFIRCTFCKCVFFESTVKRSAHFFMCNFDNSNALSEFEQYREQFTEIDFGKNCYEAKIDNDYESTDISEELLALLKPVYEYLKDKDDDLSKKLEEAKNCVDKKSVEKFLLDCSEQDFMLILSDVTMKRSSKYQTVNENDDVI